MEPPFLISIVDDDLSVGVATGSLLRANGFAVATFRSAAEFLASPELDRSRFLILDVCMPEMGGLGLYRQLKGRGRAIPTLFITGHGTAEDRAAAMAEGAVGYLAKPFTEEALLAAIGRAH